MRCPADLCHLFGLDWRVRDYFGENLVLLCYNTSIILKHQLGELVNWCFVVRYSFIFRYRHLHPCNYLDI